MRAKGMNDALRVTTLFLTTIAVLSCNNFGAATPESHEHSFLPGECLNSPNMTFYPDIFYDTLHPCTIGFLVGQGMMEDPGIESIMNSATIRLSFSLDMNIETDVSGFWNTEYRYIPGDESFSQFGSNSAKLSNEYERVYKEIDFTSLSQGRSSAYSTVYYSGGMSLTSDRTFLDFAPGENIASLAFLVDYCPWIDKLEVPGILHEAVGHTLGRAFTLAIPVDGYEVLDESITFNLSVPVKVGMYLTWLNERLTDPDAELHYRDETLTCNFTITKNFR